MCRTGAGSGLTVAPSASVIGAEVSGLDLRDSLSSHLRDELYRLLLRHQVLFFRSQHLSTTQQIAFAEAFGPILPFTGNTDPAHPGVRVVNGSTVGWHIDASGMIAPPVATVLYGVDVPPDGGDTVWASGVAAYENLPEPLKEQLAGRYVTHRELDGQNPVVAYPLVRTHPGTGQRYLYINFAPWVDPLILGMSADDSAALVAELRRAYLRPEHQVRFQWSPGSVVMWDNPVLQHTGTKDYGDHPRYMTRICLAHFHRTVCGSTPAEPGAH